MAEEKVLGMDKLTDTELDMVTGGRLTDKERKNFQETLNYWSHMAQEYRKKGDKSMADKCEEQYKLTFDTMYELDRK